MDWHTRRAEPLQRGRHTDLQATEERSQQPFLQYRICVLRATATGSIYLLCTDGVAEFNLATQKFTTLLQGSINSIYYNDGLFIGKKNEVYRYNEETANFDLYYQLPGPAVWKSSACTST